jgi:hypothetical protein
MRHDCRIDPPVRRYKPFGCKQIAPNHAIAYRLCSAMKQFCNSGSPLHFGGHCHPVIPVEATKEWFLIKNHNLL